MFCYYSLEPDLHMEDHPNTQAMDLHPININSTLTLEATARQELLHQRVVHLHPMGDIHRLLHHLSIR